jgi:hypothetical protein
MVDTSRRPPRASTARPTPAATLAAVSAASDGPVRSTTSATPSFAGGSCSRTTRLPSRALVGQCTKRAGSPATYGRTARTTSLPVPVTVCGDGESTRGGTGCIAIPLASGCGAMVIGDGSATRACRVRRKTPSGADVRICTRTWSNTPRRVAMCGTIPSVGTEVRHQRPLGSSTRTSTRDARPEIVTRSRTSSPTTASVGATTEMATRDSVMIGHTIPAVNSVKAKMPIATARCSPVTLPAAMP